MSHVDRAATTAATLTGTPPKTAWIPFQPFKHHEDADADSDSDSAWEDTPEFEASQEMLADVCDEIEEAAVIAVDAEWRVSVSINSLQRPLAKGML